MCLQVEGIGEAEIKHAASVTQAFSGREISKLAIAWQAAAYGGGAEARLDKEIFDRVLDHHLIAKKKKMYWQDSALAAKAVADAKLLEDTPSDKDKKDKKR
jgi:ATPase family AAA domain-containing protein 3A/B